MSSSIIFAAKTVIFCVICAEIIFGLKEVKADQDYSSGCTLQSLQVISRHGKRTPYVASYPTDPNTEFLSLGLTQLTNDGVIQMKEYGKTIKKRYGKFLVHDYRKVLARSSHRARCVQSGFAMLSTIYPEVTFPNPSTNTTQPVVVFSQSAKCDGALYNSYIDDVHPLYGNTTLGFKDDFLTKLFEDCSEASGLKIKTVYDGLDLYDTLLCEKVHRQIIPTWVEKVYPRLEKLNEAFFAQMYQNFSVPIGGSMLKLLLGDLKNPAKTDGTNVTINAFYYYTHDYIITALMGLLKVPMHSAPPFGATIIIEKHVGKDNKEFVKIFYFESPNSKPEFLQVEGCGNSEIGCEFEKFVSLGQDSISKLI